MVAFFAPFNKEKKEELFMKEERRSNETKQTAFVGRGRQRNQKDLVCFSSSAKKIGEIEIRT